MKSRHKEPFCSQKRVHLCSGESHSSVLSLLLSPADFNLAGPHMSLYSAPHMCIWCLLNINASWQDPFSSSFVSENVAKKMCNVHPPQNETFSEWDYLQKPRAPCVILAPETAVSVHCLIWSNLGIFSL